MGVGVALFAYRALHPPAGGATAIRELTSRQAYEVAAQRLRESRPGESLPYFRRALTSPAPASAHGEFGMALYYSVFEAETLDGVARPVYAGTAAQVAVMRECVSQLTAAIESAPEAHERATWENRLGRVYQAWGFPNETYHWYWNAAVHDASNDLLAAQANGYLAALRDPVHAPDETPDSLPAASR